MNVPTRCVNNKTVSKNWQLTWQIPRRAHDNVHERQARSRTHEAKICKLILVLIYVNANDISVLIYLFMSE